MSEEIKSEDNRTPFQKFEDGLRLGLAAPKAKVEERIKEEALKRKKPVVSPK